MPHACCPIEGRRRDSTLYIHSELANVPLQVLEERGNKQRICIDSGYN